MRTLTPHLFRPSTLGARPSSRTAVTLIEMLVATAVTLLLVGMVVSIFGVLSDRVSDARAMIEIADRVRATKQRLQQDLQGITVTMLPPRRPEDDEGYFEGKEGPIGPIVPPQAIAYIDRDLDGDYREWKRVMGNCAVTELVLDPEPALLSFNQTEHLAGL